MPYRRAPARPAFAPTANSGCGLWENLATFDDTGAQAVSFRGEGGSGVRVAAAACLIASALLAGGVPTAVAFADPSSGGTGAGGQQTGDSGAGNAPSAGETAGSPGLSGSRAAVDQGGAASAGRRAGAKGEPADGAGTAISTRSFGSPLGKQSEVLFSGPGAKPGSASGESLAAAGGAPADGFTPELAGSAGGGSQSPAEEGADGASGGQPGAGTDEDGGADEPGTPPSGEGDPAGTADQTPGEDAGKGSAEGPGEGSAEGSDGDDDDDDGHHRGWPWWWPFACGGVSVPAPVIVGAGGDHGPGVTGVPGRRVVIPPTMQLPPELRQLPGNVPAEPTEPTIVDAGPGVAGTAVEPALSPISMPVIVAPRPVLGSAGGVTSAGEPLAPGKVPAAPRATHGEPPQSGAPRPAQAGAERVTPEASYRMGYGEYLKTAGLSQIAGVAGTGVAGILLLTCAGGLLGYRQAKAGHAVRTGGVARFVK